MLEAMRYLILILFAVGQAVTAAEVFRWTDEDGVEHFSDRPIEGAERVELQEAQTFSAPAPPRRSREAGSSKDEAGDEEDEFTYDAVNIVSPDSGEVFWNTGGSLRVAVNTQPGLRRGHTQMIYLDGQVVASLTGNQRSAQLSGIERGQHTLSTEVRDGSGDVVSTGNSVTFTVQQTSALNPNNPNVPGPAPR